MFENEIGLGLKLYFLLKCFFSTHTQAKNKSRCRHWTGEDKPATTEQQKKT